MTCKRAARLSSAYLEGDLSPAMQSAFRGHLRVCETCRAGVESEAAIASGLGELARADDAEPPPALWDKVAAQLAAEEIADSRRPGWQLWWARARPHLGVAGLLLGAGIAAVALWVMSEQMDGAPKTRIAQGEPALAEDARSPQPAIPFAAARRDEIAAADRLYQDTVAELRAALASEKPGWPAARASAVSSRLAAIEAQKRAARQKLLGGDFPDARARDALYAAYQAEIEALREAVMIEVPRPEVPRP